MIEHLDNLLRQVLLSAIDELRDDAQIGFQPPDEDWRNQVANLTVDAQPANAVNVYLLELRENRQLRSNERLRRVDNGIVTAEPAPARVDCHYVLSAWSGGAVTPLVEPTLDEHRLLYQVLAALTLKAPLNPSRVYPPGSAALAAVPELIRDTDLPTETVPEEGLPKLAEFWGAMGANHRWKPVVHLVVTLPVALEREIAGPMVTTRITEYRRTGEPETAEAWIRIGGHVLDATGAAPSALTGAWVALETPGGDTVATTETDDGGRFAFGDLRAGAYRLRTWATGLGERVRDVDVPSPSGEYDLRFE